MAGNPYETLGVPVNATKAKIKAAFRKLAKRYHLDVNHDPGSEEKFKRINDAYNTLQNGVPSRVTTPPWWQGGSGPSTANTRQDPFGRERAAREAERRKAERPAGACRRRQLWGRTPEQARRDWDAWYR